jgi:hypothetical protein
VWKNWDDLFEPIIDQVRNLYCCTNPYRPRTYSKQFWSYMTCAIRFIATINKFKLSVHTFYRTL